MLYKTDIANMALGRLGLSSTIADLENDFSTEAKIIKRHFRTSLDYLLEQHEWNFAKRSVKLSLQFTDPEEGYGFSYHWPVKALVIRQIAPEGRFIKDMELYPDQKIHFEERYIGTTKLVYTDLDLAYAQYTEQVDSNSVFPNHFGRSLAAQLSKDVAPSLITNNFPKIKAALNSEADNDIASGIADDLARQPQFQDADSTFVRCRY